MKYIDLRSDTVTQPTEEMRQAMYTAPVGDDVLDDDPTVRELEELSAKLVGKESALFVTSGTQGNAVCVLSQTQRGETIIMDKTCHIADHEAGSYAMLAGVSPVFTPSNNGVIIPESLDRLIVDKIEVLTAKTGLICLENALSNGNVASVDNFKEIYQIAKSKKIPVHIDGARIFNASTYLNVDVKEITQYSDTVMFCLSKGLCAPVGSIVAGSKEFITKARKYRKVLGGGLRQSGILAAAGIVAINNMRSRLVEDHQNAHYLATKLSELPGITLDISSVKINMVFFTTDWSKTLNDAFSQEMFKRGIKTLNYGGEYRMVTNHDVTREDCDKVVSAITEILTQYSYS